MNGPITAFRVRPSSLRRLRGRLHPTPQELRRRHPNGNYPEVGITQAEAARRIRVSRITWAGWESGRNPIPKSGATLIAYLRLQDESSLKAIG